MTVLQESNAFADEYRGTGTVLGDGFLRRVIRIARVYRRAAGFFSSSVFAVASEEFEAFFLAGGSMELICSPVFDDKDIQTLAEGLYGRVRHFARIPPPHTSTRNGTWPRSVLRWAIAAGQLHIKVARVVSGSRNAVFHEKFGLLFCDGDLTIGFDGSANESVGGYISNFERIRVCISLRGYEDRARIDRLKGEFDQLWRNLTPGLHVVSLHEAFSRGLLEARANRDRELWSSERGTEVVAVQPEIIGLPPRLELRQYQRKAIDAWFEKGGRGILAMATGTGKTVTAFAAISKLFERVGPPLVIIVVAPLLHLVDQWSQVGQSFGLNPLKCVGNHADWAGAVDAAVYLTNSGARSILSIVTTNATFGRIDFQRVLSQISVRTVLVADEVHNLGARNLQNALPERISLRLGLSATPIRWMDDDGTQVIDKYFGGVVYSFDLEAALKTTPPVLSPYMYHPVLVDLDADETEEYLQITRLLARSVNNPRTDDLSDAVLHLLLRRDRLVATARNKVPALARELAPFKDTYFNLVYCGDGSTELEGLSETSTTGVEEEKFVRQIDAITRVIGHDLGMTVSQYTAATSSEERERLKIEFESRQKQVLVAIRCLDEGVDIPAIRRAFILASSTNPRQFIQRRGRVLRRADGKERADIYDFMVVPPVGQFSENSSEFKVLKSLVAKEMARVIEFARLALNGPQAKSKLLPLLSKMHLLDM